MPNQQSPINLTNQITLTEFKKPLKIRWSKHLEGSIAKDHGFSIRFSGDKRERISFDGLDFQIIQYHFHHKSEHWLDGKQFPLELHMVHQNCDVQGGGIAVLGVFIDSEKKPRGSSRLVQKTSGSPLETNPRRWLPSDVSHYFRYEGSLTTPGYDENVSWIVFPQPLLLPKADIRWLIRHAAQPARLPQPISRRFVLANF